MSTSKKTATKSETDAAKTTAPRKRTPEPDPSVFPASAPYEPAATAWRGRDMGGTNNALTGVEGGSGAAEPEDDATEA